MSIMSLIGVGKLDEVGNWEVIVVKAVAITEVTTGIVRLIGELSRYSSSYTLPRRL